MPSFFYAILQEGRMIIMKQLYIDIFDKTEGVKAFFSTKYGASEGSPYYNEAVLSQLGLTDLQMVQPHQVHEAKIGIIEEHECRVIDEEGVEAAVWGRDEAGPEIEGWGRGANGNEIRLPRTDGVITDQQDILLTTVHADCLPVWFYDRRHHAVGLVHAGWKGTLAGIAPKAAALMQKTYGSDPAELLAYIGPGISECCFETGPEVIEAFREKWDFADDYAKAVKELPKWKRLADIKEGITPGKFYIDLKGINREELLRTGLKAENITVSRHCTCCEPEIFASYRREGGTYMRMGAGICLTD